MIENRQELLKELKKQAKKGDLLALALAYLVNDIVPKNRTTKRVFMKIKND